MLDIVLYSKILYNPDKWNYVEFYFYETTPSVKSKFNAVYEVLYLSL
ncbi:DUF4865 family protein [Carnobacterium divergens]